MSAIVLQSKRPKGVMKVIEATAIGPFESLQAADKHATELCRKHHDEYLYSVLVLVPPASDEDKQ